MTCSEIKAEYVKENELQIRNNKYMYVCGLPLCSCYLTVSHASEVKQLAPRVTIKLILFLTDEAFYKGTHR